MMGSSGGGDIDCSVGTIVWVRRRNGSWWPGKILGPEELSASHLMSPRSGTPVKLLGREDASVDWYNLEKSRRVKAFRCGDFDDCIERAESSLGMPAKKREKYARREDAILHALELEKQMLDNKIGILDVEMATNCQEKRRKRVNFPTESIDCFNRRENPPIQMETSLSQAGVNNCHALPGSSYEGSSSGSTEDDESDSSETQSLYSETEEEMAMVSDSAGALEVEQRSLENFEGQVDDESTSSDELDETTVTGDTSHFHPHSSISGGGGGASDELDETAIMGDTSQLHPHGPSGGGEMSKWQLKGKRNARSLAKRTEDLFDGRGPKGSIPHKRASVPNFHFITRSDNFESSFDDFDLIDNDNKAQAIGFDSRVYSLTSKRQSSVSRYVNEWDELACDDRPAFKGYREKARGHFDPIFVGSRHPTGGRVKSMLIDVDLKVQASYPKEHVPIVSLMSRLNGKAIIGHPIQIEALEDGFSDMILSGNDELGSEATLHDGNAALQPVWRTARRTANRVPRPHLSPTSDGDDTAEQLPFHKEKKPPIKKLNAGSPAQKAGRMRGAPRVPRPPMNRKIARKPQKKVSLSSSQKIRTLSSIAVEQRVDSKSKHENGNSYVAGLIKTESGPTTVACIPVKLVFSRLFEGVSRPPSRAAGHGEL